MTCANPAPGIWICRPTIKATNVWKVKWCFGCRRRRSHRLHFTSDAWYDPEPVWRCPRCKRDDTRFPES